MLLPGLDSFHAVRDFLRARTPGDAPPVVSAELPVELVGAEFRSRTAVLDRHLTRLGPLPWGIVFTLSLTAPLVAVLMILLLLGLQNSILLPEDRERLSIEAYMVLAVCIVTFFGLWFAEKAWKKRIKNIDFLCPSCHQPMANRFRRQLIPTGKCGTCGRELSDL